MRASVCIASLNIKGRRSGEIDKWMHVPQTTRERNLGILAVQETHLTDTLADQFESLFGGKFTLFHSPDPETQNVRGIAIVLNKKLVKTQGTTMTTLIPGRAILMTLPWHNDSKINILAVYSPNAPTEIRDFWKTIIDKTTEEPLLKPDIVLGDFNLVEDALDRIPSRPDDAQATNRLREFKTRFNLINGWRKAHPKEKGYTWLRDSDGTQSRIDRIYVNENLFKICGEWKIETTPIPTDHDIVSARITTPTSPEIGRGRWAIPTRLLKNKTLKVEIQKLGTDLENQLKHLNPLDTDAASPQSILRDFKTKVRETTRQHKRRFQPILKKKIMNLAEKLREATNDPSLHPDEIKITSTHLKKEMQRLLKEVHGHNRDSVAATDAAKGEKIGKMWSNRFKESKPRDTIRCLRTPNDDTLTFDSRKMAQIAMDYHNKI